MAERNGKRADKTDATNTTARQMIIRRRTQEGVAGGGAVYG